MQLWENIKLSILFPLGEARASKVWTTHKSQQIQNAVKENRNFIVCLSNDPECLFFLVSRTLIITELICYSINYERHRICFWYNWLLTFLSEHVPTTESNNTTWWFRKSYGLSSILTGENPFECIWFCPWNTKSKHGETPQRNFKE